MCIFSANFKLKRTAAASGGFLATARLSCLTRASESWPHKFVIANKLKASLTVRSNLRRVIRVTGGSGGFGLKSGFNYFAQNTWKVGHGLHLVATRDARV